VILFGLTTMDVLRIPLLSMDTRKQWGGRRDWGYLSSSDGRVLCRGLVALHRHDPRRDRHDEL
jgi:hypothetical protein